ncbi:hypothetical protein BJV78DRAFT_1155047 [Lactifluus subvellereus]|nr:hypothetical protein BJV78DRAFT_1155047 [Lactifluus subvellereus]
MKDQEIQDFKPPQCLESSEVPNIGDPRFQDSLLWHRPSQLHDPPTQTTCSRIPDAMDVPGESVWSPNVGESLPGPSGLLQAQPLGMPPPMDQALDSFDRSFWVGFRAFSDDSIFQYVNGSLPDQRITAGDDDPHLARGRPFVQTAQSPSTQWHDVSHGQSSRSYSEDTSGTHPTSPFRSNQDQILEKLEPIGSQRSPQTESAQRSMDGGRASREWRCCACPDKKYQRAQELKRHIRDTHQRPQKCPFCHTKWTRPEKIRSHLMAYHRDSFTEEEQREFQHLRGRKNVIRFLENVGDTWLP